MTGEEFQAERERLGLTQAQLAQAFGFSIRAISMIETGQRKVQRIHELALRAIKLHKGLTSGGNVAPIAHLQAMRSDTNDVMSVTDMLQGTIFELANNPEYEKIDKAMVIILNDKGLYHAEYRAANIKESEMIGLCEIIKTRLWHQMFDPEEG